MTWFPNSLSLIVRQTPRVHQELTESFAQMRRMADRDPASKFRRPRLRWTGAEDAPRNYNALMYAIQQNTSGEWENEEGVGGTMSPHAASLSLMIKQPDRVHTEIEDLLARLRRARYVAGTIATRDTLTGIDDEMYFFDQPVLTNLPRDVVLRVTPAEERQTALDRLAVRKVPDGVRQRWRRTAAGSAAQEVALARMGNRLDLESPDRVLRAEGVQAAVGYPRLGLVEVDAWGEAVRQLADGAFPWLPHRSNAELVQLFEVDASEETPEATTLRLTFRQARDVQIRAVFAKATGQPTAWTVIQGDDTLLTLRCADGLVTAVDAEGRELERWERLADEPLASLPSLADFDARWLVVQIADNQDPLNAAREALRQNDYAAATASLRQLLARSPDQPLINFLFAWSREFAGRLNADDLREQRAALEKVVHSDALDLVRWLNAAYFPTLGAEGLLAVMESVPVPARQLAVLDQLSELAAAARRYPTALLAAARALELDPQGAGATPRRLLQVELLLRTHDAAAAQRAAEEARQQGLSVSAQCELGDLFYRFDQPELAALWYHAVLERDGVAEEERAQLLARQAIWLAGEARWNKLFDALASLPDKHPQQPIYLDTIIQETAAPQTAFVESLARKIRHATARRKLLLHAAEITDDPQRSAQIAWDLFQQGDLPTNHRLWLLQRLLNAGRGQDVVTLLEARLRGGEALDLQSLEHLAAAYQQSGRQIEAHRAKTQDAESPAPPAPPQPQPQSRRFWNPLPGSGFF